MKEPSPVNSKNIRVLFDQRVPMRHGITLSADVYLPAQSAQSKDATANWPVILLRTPYIKASLAALEIASYYNERGYVAMDVRGRGDSDGQCVPYFNDGQDGYDAIE